MYRSATTAPTSSVLLPSCWDALTDAQKELVEGENADPDYFGRDTGDASKDAARNEDNIGENELLVVSFGTSFNDSRVKDIKGIEDACRPLPAGACAAPYRTDHHQPCAGTRWREDRQYAAGAGPRCGKRREELIVQPTHLMHGAEYDEMNEMLDQYRDKFESVAVAEPLLASGRRCFRHQCR